MLSASSRYAIRATLYLASRAGEGEPYIPIRQIASDLDISFHFLTKILQQLSRQGLITSYRGPSGGVALNRGAKQIKLIDIIECLDGERLFTGCLLGLAECTDDHPCAVHREWTKERVRLSRLFSRISLAHLMRSTAAAKKR